jgi:hypothetical protein
LFAVVETALNSYLEPIIYGKTTGISALGLLVAATFWTWLWGTMGLLLSTPLTVCLAVLGKYVPNLSFFAALLREDVDLEPDVRFYQRLVALDRDGAIEVVETALEQWPNFQVFDEILVPTLSRAERDLLRAELDDVERTFVWQVVGDLLDRLEAAGQPELRPASPMLNGEPRESRERPSRDGDSLLGVAVEDTSDVLVLRMLGQLLEPSGLHLRIIADTGSPLVIADQVGESSPRLVILSNLPPDGLTMARYLVRRLRAHFPELPLVVGRWDETRNGSADRLVEIGAFEVVHTLADARDRILRRILPETAPEPASAPLP